jgi:hypothetical protein
MLRFAEDELGLPTLTNRDKGANDMFDAFDFSQSPRQNNSCQAQRRRKVREACSGTNFKIHSIGL